MDLHTRPAAGRGSRLAQVARILVVEDEPNNLELALRIVRHAGHEATVATDGYAALELAREQRPQLILLDLQLPKLDGWAVVKRLRKESWAKDVPIVAVSASASPGDESKAIEAGCTEFLSKPYYPATLRDVLNRYLVAA
ncbi:MAG: response regulator [Chloroflexi bacterium]|nr:MAG: response regulator [Chloroflexota bacterium]